MLDDLIQKLVNDEITKLTLKDKMTGYLVEKKKRGTFQALQECSEFEIDIRQKSILYIQNWLKDSLLLDNALRKKFISEVKSQVSLELARKGFGGINL